MRLASAARVLSGLLVLLAGAPALAQSPAATVPAGPGRTSPAAAELEAFVDGIVRDSLVQDHIVGATVAIVQDGQVILKKGYGSADLSPRRPDFYF
ncbi:MAG: hypothetical protein ACKN9P_16560, partial [Phenylobacterium sp.]